MLGYGFGSIVGSGVYDFTVCFGIASIFSYSYHKKAISFKLKPLLRDIYIYLFNLLVLVYVIYDLEVNW